MKKSRQSIYDTEIFSPRSSFNLCKFYYLTAPCVYLNSKTCVCVLAKRFFVDSNCRITAGIDWRLAYGSILWRDENSSVGYIDISLDLASTSTTDYWQFKTCSTA